MSSESILKKGQKATLLAGSITLFFALAKAVVGFFSGSIILLADAVHSGADAFSTAAAWFGLKIAQKEPTEKFPYGFYKVENITALLISILIFFAGYGIAKESFHKLFSTYEINIPFVAIGVAVLDALFMFTVGTYEVKVGRKINSQSLMADGRESRLHLLSSSIVLVGLVAAFFKVPYLEGAAGLLISLFIFQAGFESLKDSVSALMDISPSKEIENRLKDILKNISGVQEFNNLKLRKSGPFIFGEVKIKIRKQIAVKRAYEVSSNIEKKIKSKIKQIDSFAVVLEPFQTETHKVCIPIENNKNLDSQISEHFARAENFIFLLIEKGEVKKEYVKKNLFKEKDVRTGLKIVESVMKEKIDTVITKEIGPISLSTLRDNLVDVYQGKQDTVREVLESFSRDRLRELKIATRKKA